MVRKVSPLIPGFAALGRSFPLLRGEGGLRGREWPSVGVERSFPKAMIWAQQEAQLSKLGSWLSIQKLKRSTYQVIVVEGDITSCKGDFLTPPFHALLHMEINELSGLRVLVHESCVTDVRFQVYQLPTTEDTRACQGSSDANLCLCTGVLKLFDIASCKCSRIKGRRLLKDQPTFQGGCHA